MKINNYILFVCLILFPIQTYAQYDGACKYPIDSTADFLVKSIIKTTNKYNNSYINDRELNSDRFNKNFYDGNLKINYDSIFHICFGFLVQKLGRPLVCNNIEMFVNSFYVSPDKKKFHLSLNFIYPFVKDERRIKLKNPVSFDKKINIKFEYGLIDADKIQIKFPSNLPNCNGLENNCFKITEQQVLKILKRRFLIKKGDKIHMFVEGDYWKVGLTEDGVNFRNLTVDLNTGKCSKVAKITQLKI